MNKDEPVQPSADPFRTIYLSHRAFSAFIDGVGTSDNFAFYTRCVQSQELGYYIPRVLSRNFLIELIDYRHRVVQATFNIAISAWSRVVSVCNFIV